MLLILSCLGCLRGAPSIVSILANAGRAYEGGDLDQAEQIYRDGEAQFISNAQFQNDYFKFLMKTGRFSRIVELSAACAPANRHYVESAEKGLQALKSKDLRSIAELLKGSPNFYDGYVAKVELALQTLDEGSLSASLLKLDKLRPGATKNDELRGRYNMLAGNYATGMEYLSKAGLGAAAGVFAGLHRRFQELTADKLFNEQRFARLKDLYRDMYQKYYSDKLVPSIYTHLLKRLLDMLVTRGCAAGYAGVLEMARKLFKIEASGANALRLIEAHVAEKRPVGEAKKVFSEHRALLSAAQAAQAEKLLQDCERQQQYQRQQQQRQEQQRQQQQQFYQRQTQQQPTNKAGKDFLGYYAALGVKNNATKKELDKGFKKAMLLAQRIDDQKEQQKKSIEINDAYQQLSDEKHRKLYDQGIDPTKQSAGGYHDGGHGHFHGGQQFVVNNDFDDIFNAFFSGGGGQSFGRGGQQFSRQVFYSF
ncbi:hypothetical protein PAPHI01_1589 [Pancytospora philotis]|nr:hypothetical protein PAPHI01_1589 [Pancytospora philotis]